MRLIQLTLSGSGANQISPNTDTVAGGTQVYVSYLIIQNNAGHSLRVGDNTVSSTKGILIASGTPGGSVTAQFAMPRGSLLSQWYIAGTNADVIDILYETSQ